MAGLGLDMMGGGSIFDSDVVDTPSMALVDPVLGGQVLLKCFAAAGSQPPCLAFLVREKLTQVSGYHSISLGKHFVPDGESWWWRSHPWPGLGPGVELRSQ